MCLDPLGIEQFFSLDEICAIEKKKLRGVKTDIVCIS